MDALLVVMVMLLLWMVGLLGVLLTELFTPLEYEPLTAHDLNPECHNRSSWITPEDDPACHSKTMNFGGMPMP